MILRQFVVPVGRPFAYHWDAHTPFTREIQVKSSSVVIIRQDRSFYFSVTLSII